MMEKLKNDEIVKVKRQPKEQDSTNIAAIALIGIGLLILLGAGGLLVGAVELIVGLIGGIIGLVFGLIGGIIGLIGGLVGFVAGILGGAIGLIAGTAVIWVPLLLIGAGIKMVNSKS